MKPVRCFTSHEPVNIFTLKRCKRLVYRCVLVLWWVIKLGIGRVVWNLSVILIYRVTGAQKMGYRIISSLVPIIFSFFYISFHDFFNLFIYSYISFCLTSTILSLCPFPFTFFLSLPSTFRFFNPSTIFYSLLYNISNSSASTVHFFSLSSASSLFWPPPPHASTLQ